jgi:hypothetical protein
MTIYGDMPAYKNPVFVVGMSRLGTTLIQGSCAIQENIFPFSLIYKTIRKDNLRYVPGSCQSDQ